jgi:hypothetical protein
MKKIFLFAILGSAVVWSACESNERYLDLETGEKVELVKDDATGLMVNAETKKPVYIYVDTKTKDTIYGKTGKVINGSVVLVDGKYIYQDDVLTAESETGDYKRKVEKDGDIKIKDGDTKTKIDGETGEKKVKND